MMNLLMQLRKVGRPLTAPLLHWSAVLMWARAVCCLLCAPSGPCSLCMRHAVGAWQRACPGRSAPRAAVCVWM